MLKNKNKAKLSVDLDNNITQQPSLNEVVDESLTEEALTASNFDNQPKQAPAKKEVWLKPITKKKFILKLIPFMILVAAVVGFSIFLIVMASIKTTEELGGANKLNYYLFPPILFVVAFPFAFYLFDRAYCQYNLKHNEKMKQKLGKIFVKNYSQNGCFKLKEIYLNNPNQLCWLNNQAVIIENYKRWDPAAYEEDIKYYREHKY